MFCSEGKTRILFVHSGLPAFVRGDFEILQKHFDVESMGITTFLVPRRGRDWLVYFRLLKGILRSDVVYSWWADLNAFFTVLFSMFLRRKSIIVVGGYDVIYVPEIDYGTLKSRSGRLRVKFVLDHATKILPFSNYARDRVSGITKKANIHVVPLGCDTGKFRPLQKKKEDLVITVCAVSKGNIIRKGLETFIETAKFLSNAKFTVIGRRMDDSVKYLKAISPANVEFTGYVPDEELVKWYQKAKVYCQLSYEEGFGVALIEAMACGCIPVVSSKAKALRETAGDCGYYVPYGDVQTTAEAIKKASSAPNDIGAKARKRVEHFFPIEKREKELLRVIDDICAHS